MEPPIKQPEIQEAIDLLKWQLGIFAAKQGVEFYVEFFPKDKHDDYDVEFTQRNIC